MLICFPQVNFIAEQVTIPFEATEDKIIWQPSNNGDLSFEQAYEFKYGVGQNIKWAKDLWCLDIPPTKSLLVWRILHNKVPLEENLLSRGFQFPSWCSFYNILCESTFHLFFECSFAMHLWNWLLSIININMQFANCFDFLKILDRKWSPQCRTVLKACMFNIIYTILIRRNDVRFNNQSLHWKLALNMIIAQTGLAGNITTEVYRGDMQEFRIVKAFKVNIKPPQCPHHQRCDLDPSSDNLD
ncbi:putative reverse transcriptase zinc-binding domain-containing protein [Medicago truncatula]|uniref:Putative reverse transcriptase zinc-binding domain-containing protein n=1 Tax=Medicago truncatula TaxID=3880 RepID=A0A396IID7_MEDTR|nr:putative reverse transcriptase zinc-binding domain-containing protein [Medicago truncatula]